MFRAKSSKNINDRIVELSIALEYLINTDKQDVTLQLCLKLIKLLFDHNQDDTIYPKLKKFYGLRSIIIHGNSIVDDNDKNQEIVNFAEEVIQRGIVRMISLSEKYTYKDINLALVKCMHIHKTVRQILETTSN